MSSNPEYPADRQRYKHQQVRPAPLQSQPPPGLLPPAPITTRQPYSAHNIAQSMTSSALKARLAMEQAQQGTREGPWYGIWSLILDEFSVVEHGEISTTVSIIYPQFPVSAFWDADDLDEVSLEVSAMDVDPTSSSDPLDLFRASSSLETASYGSQVGQTTHVAPFTPPRESTQSRQMPSTPQHRRVLTTQPVTPYSSIPSSSPIISDFTVDERHALRMAAEIRSTRVPDFVRYAYCLKDRNVSRIDLIVELKKAMADPMVGFAKAIDQLETQAVHVFVNDDSVQVIGCIMGIGPEWRYIEKHRSDVGSFIGSDSSYYPSSHSIRSSSSQIRYTGAPPSDSSQAETKAERDLKIFFRDNGFVTLNTPLSAQMLEIVGDRLKELNEDLWYEE
jgi:hypothetical protein